MNFYLGPDLRILIRGFIFGFQGFILVILIRFLIKVLV
jgi:hypothetical protein